MNRSQTLSSCALGILAAGLFILGGCNILKTDTWRFLDPTAMVKAPATNMTNPIYSSASAADEANELPPNATLPSDSDLQYVARDYQIGPLDVIDVSILDLYAEGLETVLRRQVSESGFIDLPMLSESIKVEGLTQEQLRQELVQAYSPDILRTPNISATVVLQRQNTFSILGAVARPGTYNMVKRDMRLLDALAAAGGQAQTNIRWLLVIRPEPAVKVDGDGQNTQAGDQELPALPEIPQGPMPTNEPAAPASLADMGASTATTKSDVAEIETSRSTKFVQSADGKSTQVTQTAGAATMPSGEGAVAVAPRGLPTQPTTQGADEDIFGWKKTASGQGGRIIAIDLSKLSAGDPRMNIVIRDNDIINIPLLEQGEFYVMGEVLRPGVYSLTGRQVTVKMAVAAAGNLAPLAWPENSILIRRIGNNQEQMIPLNIESIFLGKNPDIFLKPNDVIAVGTSVISPFYAVLRNAFRLTYGFGFIYDRNFADPYPGESGLTSKRFTRF